MSSTHVFKSFGSAANKKINSWVKEQSQLGRDIKDVCPVFVYNDLDGFVFRHIYTFEEDSPRLNQNSYIIGYDVESQSIGSADHNGKMIRADKLLSHQWYFSYPTYRFGIILLTPQRLTELQLKNFITDLAPQSDAKLSDLYIMSHYSLYECGWLIPSYDKIDKVKQDGKTVSFNKPVIGKRGKKWIGKIRLMDRPTQPRKAKPGASPVGVWLHFADSMDLYTGSLKDLGETIGINKYDHDYIERMEEFLRKYPDEFYRYGIRDSVISAEALAYFKELFAKLGLKTKTRMASYSEEFFKKFFRDMHKDKWRQYMGWKQTDKRWQVSDASLSFLPYYVGGRNEVMSVGPREHAIYYDLKSAYPTAVIMAKDYDFSQIIVTRGIQEAKKRTEVLHKDGPFLIIGVACAFTFKKDAQPIFPVKTEPGPVFPRTGFGYIMWPEFWTAIEMDLFEQLTVYSVSEFTQLQTNKLAEKTAELLEKRKDIEMKIVYKNLLNFFYGKTAQGVRKINARISKRLNIGDAPTSPLTCFPLASYITSVCRAVVGELYNLNPTCHAITTDGFISPEKNLKTGYLSKIIQKRMDDIGFTFIEIAFEGSPSLFVKTRGYLILNKQGFVENPVKQAEIEQKRRDAIKFIRSSSQRIPLSPRRPTKEELQTQRDTLMKFRKLFKPTKEYFKLARMGVQVKKSKNLNDADNQVVGFLQALSDKEYMKESWVNFEQLRGEIRENDSITISVLSDIFQKLQAEEEEQDQFGDDAISSEIKAKKRENKLRRKRKDAPPMQVIAKNNVNCNFDFKRVPVKPVPARFTFQGVNYDSVSFETVPLYCVDDFNLMRRLAKRNLTAEQYWELQNELQQLGIDFWKKG
ncbi:MAG: hypothetical protein WCP20_17565 [Desulfuromonadales bacterium]